MRCKVLLLLNNDRGIVLVIALVLMGLLSALAGAYAMLVRADTVLSGGASRTREGFYAAEAGLNVGMAETAEIFRNYGTPQASDYEEHSVTVGERTVHYKLDPVPGYDPCTEGEDEGCYTTIPAGEKFAGLKSIPYRYTVHSSALNSEGDNEADLGGQFDVHNIPIFQFLAFYANDLEILPGPPATMNGRVHTNGNLYLNADNSLTIGDLQTGNANTSIPNVQISAAGSIYRGRKNNTTCIGTVTIDKLEDIVAPTPDYDPRVLACVGGATSVVSQSTLDAYKGSMLKGVDTVQIPPIDTIERGSDGDFWQHADLRIILRLDLPRAATDFGAADLCQGGPGTLTSPALYPIEVQNADGSRNDAKTRKLWKFMCEMRGSIFYNDRPNTAVDNTPSDSVARDKANYTPAFSGSAAINGTSGGAEHRYNQDYRVYRRLGLDSNGDGQITNTDLNFDVCPNDTAVAANPWWKPSYCNNFDGDGVAGNSRGRWFYDMDYRRGGFYNYREAKWMYLLNVNMRALLEWNQFNGDPLFPSGDRTDWGLVIFLSVQGPTFAGRNNYGVRIFDSADLDTRNLTFPTGVADPSGLTVVSDQAVYIEGNYNSRNKYPAAVIGDSLNVLSQSWERPMQSGGNTRENDRKSFNALSNYRAVQGQDARLNTAAAPAIVNGANFGGVSDYDSLNYNFRVNAAYIAGVDNTVGGSYSGGLENYPRFHEEWGSGRLLIYRGSFVSLGNPQHVQGQWSAQSYSPPARDWNYDAMFNRVENLPPLTPKITYVQQRLYTRFYK